METIIQAGNKRLRIASVPITTNAKTRESRLFKNIWHHMFKSATAIIRSFLMFKPHVVLGVLGTVMGVAALIPFVRFFVFWLAGDASGHVQSLIFGTAMLVGALLSFALLVIADLLRTNRILQEETLERLKTLQYQAPGLSEEATADQDDEAWAAGGTGRAAGTGRGVDAPGLGVDGAGPGADGTDGTSRSTAEGIPLPAGDGMPEAGDLRVGRP